MKKQKREKPIAYVPQGAGINVGRQSMKSPKTEYQNWTFMNKETLAGRGQTQEFFNKHPELKAALFGHKP